MVLFVVLLAILPSVLSLHLRASYNVFSTAAQTGSDSLDLTTVRDVIYMANITIGGTQYPIQIDTGSSDLWITTDSGTMPNIQETSTMINLTYSLGWAYGNLAYSNMEFSGVSVPNQAFVHATHANAPSTKFGVDGILGLGFTALSNIDVAQEKANNYTGRSLLYNMFDVNKTQPNFIAFALQRVEDSEDPNAVEGIFSIGEVDPEYKHVQDTAPIPTFPVTNPTRWNVLIDAIMVGQNVTVPTTQIPGAPANSAVALLDTGTSYTYVPVDVAQAIYGGISGAHYDSVSGYWNIPCNEEIDVALQIGGQVIPLHPLDVSPISLADKNTCIGSFVQTPVAVGAGQFDWLIGDNVLRSMYNIYDFGDYDASGNLGNPYVKLLPLINPDEASAEFAKARGSTARTGITYGNTVAGAAASSDSTTISLSTSVAQSLNLLGSLLPAIVAIMALNALTVLGASIYGIWYCCRRKKRSRVPTRSTRGRMTPMPVDVRNSYVAGSIHEDSVAGPHAYQPVSMAMTEDTLMPMTPNYSKFGISESKIQPGDRPRSMAIPLRVHRESESTMDEPFLPPSPAFHQDGGHLRPGAHQRVDRPNSVA